MSHDSTSSSNGPWRLPILDRSADDPKFILATVASPVDIRPVTNINSVTLELDDVTITWAARRGGLSFLAITRLPHPEVWRIDEGGRP
jgi:hypothetical protein